MGCSDNAEVNRRRWPPPIKWHARLCCSWTYSLAKVAVSLIVFCGFKEVTKSFLVRSFTCNFVISMVSTAKCASYITHFLIAQEYYFRKFKLYSIFMEVDDFIQRPPEIHQYKFNIQLLFIFLDNINFSSQSLVPRKTNLGKELWLLKNTNKRHAIYIRNNICFSNKKNTLAV